MATTHERSVRLAFRPRARLLLLLGDQLIRDQGIAVFELVKNAYDADAPRVVVTLEHVDDPVRGRIVVEDEGTGMDWDTVTGVWLEPGTDHRAEQRLQGGRTPRFNRVPLGEKGVGRFAAHKLGRQITLVTRARGEPEIVVEIDWDAFLRKRYLDDALVEVSRRAPEHFRGKATGTRIEIGKLQQTWTRGAVRDLTRNINSIRSPFAGPSDFLTDVRVRPQRDWLEGILDVETVLERAMFRGRARISDGDLHYEYEFDPLPGIDDRIAGRREQHEMEVLLPRAAADSVKSLRRVWRQIGPLRLDLFMFDRDPSVLTYTTSDRRGFSRFLNENGGVRVYRDGIRVFDYGSSEDDWLGLDERRVNRPAQRISNRIAIGAVELDLEQSPGLIEKTNREGFVENDAYRIFRESVQFSVVQLETERAKDKSRMRDVLAGSKRKLREPVLAELRTLRERLRQEGLDEELGEYVDRVERQFEDVRDRLLTAAGAGLSMAMVVHELEKGVAELNRALDRGVERQRVEQLAEHLSELVDGLGYLTRRSGMSREKASDLVRYALLNTEYRLEYHGIATENTLADAASDNFRVRCHRRLVVATLMNLIDNSIWWMGRRGGPKRLWIGTSHTVARAPALVVADSGPGFSDDPETLVEPFLSRRPDGMGLGLHLAAEVMKTHKGRLGFPEADEVPLPEGVDGAAVALIFPEAQWMG